MAFGKSPSIGDTKKGLYTEGVAVEEIGKQQAGVSESTKKVAGHLGGISGLLDQLGKELKAAHDVTKEAAGQQRVVAHSTAEHALRLGAIASGTDETDLQQAARDFQAQVTPTQEHARNLGAVDKFIADTSKTVEKLVAGLHNEPGSLALANALPDATKASADVLARAGNAANTHAPVL